MMNIERRSRFIEQYHLGILQYSRTQYEHLPLTARDFVDRPIGEVFQLHRRHARHGAIDIALRWRLHRQAMRI